LISRLTQRVVTARIIDHHRREYAITEAGRAALREQKG
jgi:DNA-binding PadR family transcriptional regulator